MKIPASVMLMLSLTGPAFADSCDTGQNRDLIAKFADLMYTKHQVAAAFAQYVAPGYIQHNPGIADGRDAALKLLVPMFSKPRARFEVKQILVDCNLAAVHLLGQEDPSHPAAAVVDIYRIQDGKIVEHWDVIQVVPTKSANPHPMF